MRSGQIGALAVLLAACGDNYKGSQLALDDVSLTTPEDTDLVVEVPYAAGDTSKATLTVTTPPLHGTLSGSGPRWTYTPAANYFWPDRFVVEAVENTKMATATVTIDVTADNDPPVANTDSCPPASTRRSRSRRRRAVRGS